MTNFIHRPSLIRPAPLSVGDTIGVLSPSGAFVGREPHWQMFEQVLSERGYRVQVAPYAQEVSGYTAGTREQRLSDFHALWSDPSIQAIWCSQGGTGSMHLLDGLDYDWIRRHPKIFIGYSDVTALLMAIHSRTGLVVFHGPMGVTDFGLMTQPFTSEQCWQILEGQANREIPYRFKNARQSKYRMLRPGVAEGPLYVGNLQLLTALTGTGYLPDLTGAVLLIEDVASFVYLIDRMLTQLRLCGVLNQLGGLVFGEFFNLMRENPIIPLNMVGAPTMEALAERFAQELTIPVGFGFSCGHAPSKTTFPLGVSVRFDAESGTLTLLEPYLSEAG